MRPSKEQLHALANLQHNPDYAVVIGMLKAELDSLKNELVRRYDAHLFHVVQGRCQAIGDLVTFSETARTLLSNSPKE